MEEAVYLLKVALPLLRVPGEHGREQRRKVLGTDAEQLLQVVMRDVLVQSGVVDRLGQVEGHVPAVREQLHQRAAHGEDVHGVR